MEMQKVKEFAQILVEAHGSRAEQAAVQRQAEENHADGCLGKIVRCKDEATCIRLQLSHECCAPARDRCGSWLRENVYVRGSSAVERSDCSILVDFSFGGCSIGA